MRVYLDTMVWIYAFENNPTFGPKAQQTFRRILDGQHITLVSHFLLAEVLVGAVRKNDQFLIFRYRRALLDYAAAEMVPFGTEAAMRFAALRATHRVKQPDAIHLALAASAGADAFITTDTRLNNLTVPGIGFIGDLSTTLP